MRPSILERIGYRRSSGPGSMCESMGGCEINLHDLTIILKVKRRRLAYPAALLRGCAAAV